MMSFVFLLLFVLEVLCLAVNGNSEPTVPPKTSDINLKCYQQNYYTVLQLGGKPPPSFKTGEHLVHPNSELECQKSGFVELCHPGSFPTPTIIEHGMIEKARYDQGLLMQLLDTRGRGSGHRFNRSSKARITVFDRENPWPSTCLGENKHNSETNAASKFDETVLRHSCSKESNNNFQTKLPSIPNISGEELKTAEDLFSNNKSKLCTVSSCCFNSEALIYLHNLKREHIEIYPAAFSSPIAVKIKMQ